MMSCQWMSAILSQAEVLSSYGDKSDANQIAAKDIRKSIGKVREVVHGLMGYVHPAALDIPGLSESLSKLMEDWCFQQLSRLSSLFMRPKTDDFTRCIQSTVWFAQ